MSLNARKGRLRFADAGRGLAALVVLVHHVMVFFGERIGVTLGADSYAFRFMSFVSSFNAAAVQFFFFLSGWAIFLALDHAREIDGKINWFIFAWHRGRRILPVYWLALAWSWLLLVPSVGREQSYSAANLFGNLLFLQTPPVVADGWFTPYAENGPLWSLAFEAWYYAATPLLCCMLSAMLHATVKWAMLTMLFSMLVALSAIAANQIWFTPLAAYAAMWPIWVAGFVFATLRSKRLNDRIPVAIFFTCFGGIIGLSGALRSDSLSSLASGLGVATISAAAFMAIESLPPIPVGKRFRNSVVSFLITIGAGSYTLYVLHYPLLRWFSEKQVNSSIVIVALITLTAVAPIFEQELQRRFKNISLPRTSSGTLHSAKERGEA